MVHEHNNLFKLENLFNVRHLGSLPTEDGAKTKDYKYIRGSAKGSLTEEEKKHFYDLGTRIIVDLRYTNEIEKSPSPLRGFNDMQYFHVDMMGEFWQMREKGYGDLSDLYLDLLNDSQEKIATVLRIFSQHQEEGVYFHCTAGKDRTGVITMLMLMLIGVPRDVIVANYAESYENNKERPGYKFMKPEYFKFVYSEPAYIERAMDHVNEKYGGVDAYLTLIGLTEQEKDNLKKSLL